MIAADKSEAGDNISQDEFNDILAKYQNYYSSGIDLFVEDAAIIATSTKRIGVRVISDNAAVALIARSLLIPVPPYEVIPLARLDGWRFDPRNIENDYSEGYWDENSKSYNVFETPQHGGKGQRPIVVYYGGEGSDVYVQFIENS
eukprot:gene21446-27779_t